MTDTAKTDIPVIEIMVANTDSSHGVDRTSTTPDLTDILTCSAEAISSALTVSRVRAMIYDPTSRVLTLSSTLTKNSPKSDARIHLRQAIGETTLLSGDVIKLSNRGEMALEAAWAPILEKGKHTLVVPIGKADAFVGVFLVDRTLTDPAFSEEETRFLKAFAEQAVMATRHKRLWEDCERRLVNLSIVQELGNLLVSTLDTAKLLDNLATYVGDVLTVDECAIWIFDPETKKLSVAAYRGTEPEGTRSLKQGQGTVGWVAVHRNPAILTSDDPMFDSAFEPWPNAKNLMLVPLEAKGDLLGVIVLARMNVEERFTTDELEILLLFAVQAGVALENVRLYSQVEQLATTDPLTGLANRRSFQETLEAEIGRADRYGDPLSLLMMDIDHFKRINDTYGHTVGDQVLRNLGKVFMSKVRQNDLPCRIGGEEFAVIVPNTVKSQAYLLAERLMEAVRETNLFDSNPVDRLVTISIGVATYPNDAESSDGLIKSADNALYDAKHQGRNLISVA